MEVVNYGLKIERGGNIHFHVDKKFSRRWFGVGVDGDFASIHASTELSSTTFVEAFSVDGVVVEKA